MPLLALGLSYRRARVELLERLSFADDEYSKAYRRLSDLEAIKEAVLLSTCNRVEIYAEVSSYHAGFLDLKRFLSDSREVPAEEFAEPLYSHYEEDAVEHLFDVASGLDSMVLGEPQILTQVRAAYRRAEAERCTGPLLSALFRGAIRTGRRARAETAIGASPSRFIEAGAAMAELALGGLTGKSVLVVGAGAMAKLSLEHLRSRGVGQIRIVNRSLERARKLAARSDAEPFGFDALVSALSHADLVVSSTGAAGIVIGAEAVRATTADRGGRPLFLLDLAVPRDVDRSAGDLPGVEVADIDDLKAVLSEGDAPAVEVERARAIVMQEVARFTVWRRASRLAPLIQALRERGERIREAELARIMPRLGTLSERERRAVESLGEGIVAKLLHDPIVRLKELSGPGGDTLARALADLFGIEFRPGA